MLEKLKSLFNKNDTEDNEEKDAIAEVRNWYSDRYQAIVVQRNLLFLVTLVALIGVFISVFAVERVTSSKSIEPFVVEIEKKTGITNVVDPVTRSEMFADDALTKYFLIKYINARATYDAVTQNFNYNKVVRLMSGRLVYSDFRRFVKGPDGPIAKYGEQTKTEMKVRSAQIIKPGVAQVRFSIVRSGQKTGVNHFIAHVEYGFYVIDMPKDDRYINPVGFQVHSYRADEETVTISEQQ